jgi:hypothetical protein
MMRGLTRLLTLFTLLGAAACSQRPLEIGTIQLGRSLNEDSTVASFTTVFKPSDTIYVSVKTTDMGSGTIAVKWFYNGHSVGERSKTVSFKIASATEFHMQSATGFPPGSYSVEVTVDGKPAGQRSFTVAN